MELVYGYVSEERKEEVKKWECLPHMEVCLNLD